MSPFEGQRSSGDEEEVSNKPNKDVLDDFCQDVVKGPW